jgi:hypothetical protein
MTNLPPRARAYLDEHPDATPRQMADAQRLRALGWTLSPCALPYGEGAGQGWRFTQLPLWPERRAA